MKPHSIHLGYEVATAEPVSVPVFHMAITGQTQKSGKTTTLEALISRSGLTGIAFVTKRGEGSFTAGRQMKPFFRERADSEFVRSILESVMREKMRFERAWISKACKGAKTLAGVQRNCHQLQATSTRSLDQDMYMLLGEYLDKVVPLIGSLPKADDLPQACGLNVMDLSRYPTELQMLVISSTLQKIYDEMEGVITIIPECWEFVPQSRNTPVKMIVEKLARKGAGLKNYIWLDSQDMAGVDKLLLRSCAVWLIGVQRESNELRRSLANMPGGMKKPKADDLATLQLGQFYLSHDSTLKKVYVQPAWMENDSAVLIAKENTVPLFDRLHKLAAETAQVPVATGSHIHNRSCWEDPGPGHGSPFLICGKSELDSTEEEAVPKIWTEDELFHAATANRRISSETRAQIIGIIRALLPLINGQQTAEQSIERTKTGPSKETLESQQRDEKTEGWCGTGCSAPAMQEMVQRVIDEIRKDPVLIRLSQERPAIEVKIERKTVQMDEKSFTGRIAVLIHEHFFNGVGKDFGEIRKELIRRGMNADTGNVHISKALNTLTQMGFFHRDDNKGYILAPGADVRVVE